jgi:hypothetical protein
LDIALEDDDGLIEDDDGYDPGSRSANGGASVSCCIILSNTFEIVSGTITPGQRASSKYVAKFWQLL